MLVLLILSITGLLWLLHRFMSLLSVPLEKSIKALNVTIPNVPLISIDKVTESSMVLHWDSDDSNEAHEESEKDSLTTDGPPILSNASPRSISHYVLYINGIQAAIIDGSQQSCILDGLLPENNYQVDLVSFNMANFRSKSSPIYVKTRLLLANNNGETQSSSSPLDHPDELLKVLIPDSEKDTMTKHSTFRGSSPNRRSRSNTLDGDHQYQFKQTDSTKTPPHLISDINELKFQLETGLDAVSSIVKSYRDYEIDFKEEEENLIADRDKAKERRKLEDINRSSLRQEIKFLEDTRMKSDSRISIEQNKLASRLKKIEAKEREIENWKKTIVEKKGFKEKLIENEPAELEKYKLEIENINKEIFSLQSELHDIEDDIKECLASKKKLDNIKQQLQPIFEGLRTSTDKNTGLLRPEGQLLFAELIKLKPEWEEELTREVIVYDQNAESQWRAQQQKEYHKLETMKRAIEQYKMGISTASSSRPVSQYSDINYSRAYNGSNNTTNSINTAQGVYAADSISNMMSIAMSRFGQQGISYNNMSPENNVVGLNSTNDFPSSPNLNVWGSSTTTPNQALSIDTNRPIVSYSSDEQVEPISPSADILLPQDLIEGEDLSHYYPAQQQALQEQEQLLQLQLQQDQLLYRQKSFQTSLHQNTTEQYPQTTTTASPGVSHNSTFDVMSNTSLYGDISTNNTGLEYLQNPGNTSHMSRIASINNGLPMNTNEYSSVNGSSAPINITSPPPSLHHHVSESLISNGIFDLGTQTTPFPSNSPMNIHMSAVAPNVTSMNNNTQAPTQDAVEETSSHSVMYNKKSLFDAFSTGSNNSNVSMPNSPSFKESKHSKFFDSLSFNKKRHTSESSTNEMPLSVAIDSLSPQSDHQKGSLDLIRGRSTSFGSSIWNNGTTNNSNNNANWNSPFVLGAPIAITSTSTSQQGLPSIMLTSSLQSSDPLLSQHLSSQEETPKIYFGNDNNSSSNGTNERHKMGSSHSMTSSSIHTFDIERQSAEIDQNQPSSPSFFKNKLFKFGASPTKVLTKTSERSNGNATTSSNDEISADNEDNANITANSHNSTTPNSNSSGLLSTGFGSKSSRFFKLGSRRTSNATVHTQNSAHSNGSSDNNSGPGSGNSGNNNAANNTNASNSGGTHNTESSSSSSNTGGVGLLSRRLSFAAFKRNDKDKDNKNSKIIEEESGETEESS